MSEESKKKKGNWFTNLLFETTEEVVGNDDMQEDADITSTQQYTSVSDSAMNVMNIPTVGDGVFDKKFEELFEQVLAKNDLPGADYLEFRKAIKANSGLGINETAGFTIAFNNLRIGDPNLTKESLLSSIDHYKKVLSEEHATFNQELGAKIEKEVTFKRVEATELNKENEKFLSQIRDLQDKITENQEKTIKLNSEASVIEAQMSQTERNFNATLNYIFSKLDTDKQKISDLISVVEEQN